MSQPTQRPPHPEFPVDARVRVRGDYAVESERGLEGKVVRTSEFLIDILMDPPLDGISSYYPEELERTDKSTNHSDETVLGESTAYTIDELASALSRYCSAGSSAQVYPESWWKGRLIPAATGYSLAVTRLNLEPNAVAGLRRIPPEISSISLSNAEFDCADCPDLASLEGVPSGASGVRCPRCHGLHSLVGIPETARRLTAYECDGLTNLYGISQNLEHAYFDDCINLRNLHGVNPATFLSLAGCTSLESQGFKYGGHLPASDIAKHCPQLFLKPDPTNHSDDTVLGESKKDNFDKVSQYLLARGFVESERKDMRHAFVLPCPTGNPYGIHTQVVGIGLVSASEKSVASGITTLTGVTLREDAWDVPAKGWLSFDQVKLLADKILPWVVALGFGHVDHFNFVSIKETFLLYRKVVEEFAELVKSHGNPEVSIAWTNGGAFLNLVRPVNQSGRRSLVMYLNGQLGGAWVGTTGSYILKPKMEITPRDLIQWYCSSAYSDDAVLGGDAALTRAVEQFISTTSNHSDETVLGESVLAEDTHISTDGREFVDEFWTVQYEISKGTCEVTRYPVKQRKPDGLDLISVKGAGLSFDARRCGRTKEEVLRREVDYFTSGSGKNHWMAADALKILTRTYPELLDKSTNHSDETVLGESVLDEATTDNYDKASAYLEANGFVAAVRGDERPVFVYPCAVGGEYEVAGESTVTGIALVAARFATRDMKTRKLVGYTLAGDSVRVHETGWLSMKDLAHVSKVLIPWLASINASNTGVVRLDNLTKAYQAYKADIEYISETVKASERSADLQIQWRDGGGNLTVIDLSKYPDKYHGVSWQFDAGRSRSSFLNGTTMLLPGKPFDTSPRQCVEWYCSSSFREEDLVLPETITEALKRFHYNQSNHSDETVLGEAKASPSPADEYMASTYPIGSRVFSVSWNLSNIESVIVHEGKVTGHNTGYGTISARFDDGSIFNSASRHEIGRTPVEALTNFREGAVKTRTDKSREALAKDLATIDAEIAKYAGGSNHSDETVLGESGSGEGRKPKAGPGSRVFEVMVSAGKLVFHEYQVTRVTRDLIWANQVVDGVVKDTPFGIRRRDEALTKEDAVRVLMASLEKRLEFVPENRVCYEICKEWLESHESTTNHSDDTVLGEAVCLDAVGRPRIS